MKTYEESLADMEKEEIEMEQLYAKKRSFTFDEIRKEINEKLDSYEILYKKTTRDIER